MFLSLSVPGFRFHFRVCVSVRPLLPLVEENVCSERERWIMFPDMHMLRFNARIGIAKNAK